MVETTITSIDYQGNESTSTAYPVPFPFLDLNHVVVSVRDSEQVVTELTYGSDYTVSGTASGGAYSSGEVLTIEAIPATSTVTVGRATPRKQVADFNNSGPLPGESIELSLDRMIMILQEQEAVGERFLRVSFASPSQEELEAIAGGIIYFDSNRQLDTMTSTTLQSLLNLPATIIDQPTKTFVDDTARGGAVPDFVGQLGLQIDTGNVYHSDGISAGDWVLSTATLVSLGLSSTASEIEAAITKLAGIESGATADQTASEIVALLNAELSSSDWQIAPKSNITILDSNITLNSEISLTEFMSIPFKGGESYFVSISLLYSSSSSADIKLAHSVDVLCDVNIVGFAGEGGGGTSNYGVRLSNGAETQSWPTSGNIQHLLASGSVIPSADGTLSLEFAQLASNAAATIMYEGCSIMMVKM